MTITATESDSVKDVTGAHTMVEMHGEDTGGIMEGKMAIRTPKTERRQRNEDNGTKTTERSNDMMMI
jgi:hypothetical protein